MVVGRRAIRRGERDRHGRLMQIAVALQAVFVVIFVGRFVEFGPTAFVGEGLGRLLYTIVLFTHEPLSVVCVPLVLVTLVTGRRQRLDMHRDIAPMSYWIWLYSVVTGILIYVALYVWPGLRNGWVSPA
jgi:putative membrane protein